MTWRSDKYKAAAAEFKAKRKPVERSFDMSRYGSFGEWVESLNYSEQSASDYDEPSHTQTHMKSKQGLAALNARTSGENQ